MSKPAKILLGLVTIWPILYLFLSVTIVLVMAFFDYISVYGNTLALIIGVGHLLVIMLVFGLLIFYVVNVFLNNRVPNDKKAFWGIALFFWNIVAMPIYWYLYIWREPEETKIN